MSKILRPREWGRSPSCWVTWSIVIGGAIGLWLGWFLFRPWIEFTAPIAMYRMGTGQVWIEGAYVVHRVCDKTDIDPTSAWRTELVAGSRVYLFAPQPVSPPLTPGEHVYKMVVDVGPSARPEEWTMGVRVTCPGGSPEILVSPTTDVLLGEIEESPP
jgi:hypothetical protein